MNQKNQIPTLLELALQYGTINEDQYSHIQKLYHLKKQKGHPSSHDKLLMSEKLATGFQVGLLNLIHEYMIIKKRGEEFGKIAIDKGFATQEDVENALDHQKKEFKRAKIKKLIGDILVDSQVITTKQKNSILKEQTFLDKQADRIFTAEKASAPIKEIKDKEIKLTKYESQFLQIQVLDKEFAASVIEKGLATEREVQIAQKVQDESFEKENKIRILGDYMVDLNFLTTDQKDEVLEEQKRIDIKEGKISDPNISIQISADCMEATIILNEDMKSASIQDIKEALKEKGVNYGIYPDAILQCHLDVGNTEFIAAKQDYSTELIKNRNATYHFNTTIIDTETKKRGATLAEQLLGGNTYLKKDLFGKNIEQEKGYDFTFRCASGTRLSKDKTKAFAGKTGYPSLSIERKLYIHPTINVLEDADLKYGKLESYANLSVSGVLTGAYPVTTGDLVAREIRGAQINAIGNVSSHIGITDSVITSQGDIHARYLHNCRIETFGNVYIENEIIDSQIFSSNMIHSPKCFVITSSLYAKNGVELAGVGNSRTLPCIIGAGTEHHIIEITRRINSDIKEITSQLDELKNNRKEQNHYAKKTFQKMIELKIFHDRAKSKKEKLTEEFRKKKKRLKKSKLRNIVTLINNFDKRMESAVSSLKELNILKKKYEKETNRFNIKIKKLKPKIKIKISEFQFDLFTFFEWARKKESDSKIKFHKKVYAGTILKGAFSSLELSKDENNFVAFEKQNSNKKFQITIQKK